MKQQRSVIDTDNDQTLDLLDDCQEHDHTRGYGWLSPRCSFSADFVSGVGSRGSQGEIMEIMSPEGSCSSRISRDGSSSTSTEFEFALATSTFHNALFEGTADELFHGGKLLPGYITPDGKKEVLVLDPFLVALAGGESRATTSTTTAGPVTVVRESLTKSSSTAGPSPRNSKQGKWRELFATLRRVKSDSGRQRLPEEILLPPKAATIQGPRKKFFRHFFSSYGPNATPIATQDCVKMSTNPAAVLSSLPPSSASSSSTSSSSPFDSKETNNVVNPPQTSAEVAAETCVGEDSISSRGKGFGSFGTGRNGGKLGILGVPLWRVEKPVIASANLVRNPSGRFVVRNLANSSSNGSGKNSASTLQEQIRGSRAREMRRSPDNRALYTSNFRVTPILNVPAVCMGPVLRGASKAGDKGRLSNFRSLLSFRREKLPTAISTPIATQ